MASRIRVIVDQEGTKYAGLCLVALIQGSTISSLALTCHFDNALFLSWSKHTAFTRFWSYFIVTLDTFILANDVQEL